jgi:hypothetical protein
MHRFPGPNQPPQITFGQVCGYAALWILALGATAAVYSADTGHQPDGATLWHFPLGLAGSVAALVNDLGSLATLLSSEEAREFIGPVLGWGLYAVASYFYFNTRRVRMFGLLLAVVLLINIAGCHAMWQYAGKVH